MVLSLSLTGVIFMQIEQRKLDAFNILSLPAKGSIWFIKERVWAAMDHFVPKRKGHPGLVFARKHYTSLLDTVPVMIGTSKDDHGFQVSHVFGDFSKKKYTYFSVIRPCATSNPLVVQRFTGLDPDIQRNHYKASLDADEMQKLDDYLRSKGIHI